MPIVPESVMGGPAPPSAASASASASTPDASAPGGLKKTPGSSDDLLNVYDDAKTYYTAEDRHRNTRAGPRTRTYSQVRQLSAKGS